MKLNIMVSGADKVYTSDRIFNSVNIGITQAFLGVDYMSNYAIGKNAVAAVDRESAMNKFLSAEIPVGDTYPSWDGDILVYSSIESRNKRTKSDIIGRIPVQVKGKHVESFSKWVRLFSKNSRIFTNGEG